MEKKALICVLAISPLLTACSALAPIGGDKKVRIHSDIVVGYLGRFSDEGWYTAAKNNSFSETAKNLGITLKTGMSCCRQENQIAAMRNFIHDDEVNIIVLDSFTSTGWDAVLKEAKQAGKVVINTGVRIESFDLPEGLYPAFVGSDFTEEGRKAGRAMAGLLKNSSKKSIAELAGSAGTNAAEERARGFRDGMGGSGIVISLSQDGQFNQEEGKQVMEDLLAQNRDIQGVFAHNDDMALGAIEALREAGLKPGLDIQIVSIDAAPGAFAAMLAGELNVSVEHSADLAPPVFEAALKALNGERLPKFIPVEGKVFSADMPNLAEIALGHYGYPPTPTIDSRESIQAVHFTGRYEDRGTDTDNYGDDDFLTLEAEVETVLAGDDRFEAVLAGGSGRGEEEINRITATGSLNPGVLQSAVGFFRQRDLPQPPGWSLRSPRADRKSRTL